MSILFCLCSVHLIAQSDATRIVKSMLDRLDKIENISYQQVTLDKNPFGNDTATLYQSETIYFDDRNKLPYADITIKGQGFSSRTVYSGSKKYMFQKDSTYRLGEYKAFSGIGNAELFADAGLRSSVRQVIQKDPGRIRQLADTVIAGQKYFRFFLNTFDSVVNERRSFIDMYFTVDKKTLFPKTYTTIIHSSYVADSVVSYMSFYAEAVFSNFKVNTLRNNLVDFVIPSGYRPYQSKELLAKGTVAPEWNGNSIEEKPYSSRSLAGKTLLLFLTSDNCPGNQMSITMMNRLVEKFRSRNVIVLGIFNNSRKQLVEYAEVNHLDFPVIYDAQAIKDKFNAPGAPFFYVIDRDGTVRYSVFGYKEGRESDLEEALIKALVE